MSQLIEEVEQFIADDMEILRELLHTIPGLMPVSTSPQVEAELSSALEFAEQPYAIVLQLMIFCRLAGLEMLNFSDYCPKDFLWVRCLLPR